MEYLEFLREMKRLNPLMNGLGRLIAEGAGLNSMPKYYNIISGKVKDPQILQKVYDSATKVLQDRGKLFAEQL